MTKSYDYDVFMSHNSSDKKRVRNLAKRLRTHGLRVWFDEWSIKDSEDIYIGVEKGLQRSKCVLLCMSPNAFGSDWVTLERSTSMFRDPSNRQRRFVPVLFADCEIPEAIARLKYIDWRKSSADSFRSIVAACSPSSTEKWLAGNSSEGMPLPSLVVGRRTDLDRVNKLLKSEKDSVATRRVVSIVGIGGLGKTTFACALARESQVCDEFRDGVLWTSLGEKPNIHRILFNWAVELKVIAKETSPSPSELTLKLTGFLKEKRVLIIVDDVWRIEHIRNLLVGGMNCGTLITTRLAHLANEVSSSAANVHKLAPLEPEHAFDLFSRLAPEVAAHHPAQCIELVAKLEGLPLAIQVAGRMLNAEFNHGEDIQAKLTTLLSDTSSILSETLPPDLKEAYASISPKVAEVFRRSTDALDVDTRERFAMLAPFAPKPATFKLSLIKGIWGADDPMPTIRTLIDRGLLESTGSGRYQIHALLVLHARTLCED